MTEKRYKMVNTNLVDDDGLVYYLIKKDGRDVCQVFGKHTAKVIVTELNALHDENEQLKDALNQRTDQCDKYYEENEQLKQLNRNLGDFRNLITEKNVSNEKQRKELQLQMLRLYNYFENYFEDAMGLTAFSEMWDNVKEDEKWEKRRF